ncbi:hypothetical protein Godav_001788, partial [Gossypium davidsonii]|nr:hypothetical protein [Gossypium davidsonii]
MFPVIPSMATSQMKSEQNYHHCGFSTCRIIFLAMGLYTFDVSNNQLFGDIPSSMENMSLLALDLSNNTLFGGIPRWMGKMSGLEVLLMANNHFEGPIPVEFCKLNYSLKFLDLSANNISGSLPSFFSFSRLTHVYLSRNKLKGPITSFINSID